mmetsp:Transcript_60768/g.170284  ORF Transcript_60768/g.170284 Transcript_60768/m.170284 type:complete len:268 (+) Transcript_60768:1242-2045(+)
MADGEARHHGHLSDNGRPGDDGAPARLRSGDVGAAGDCTAGGVGVAGGVGAAAGDVGAAGNLGAPSDGAPRAFADAAAAARGGDAAGVRVGRERSRRRLLWGGRAGVGQGRPSAVLRHERARRRTVGPDVAQRGVGAVDYRRQVAGRGTWRRYRALLHHPQWVVREAGRDQKHAGAHPQSGHAAALRQLLRLHGRFGASLHLCAQRARKKILQSDGPRRPQGLATASSRLGDSVGQRCGGRWRRECLNRKAPVQSEPARLPSLCASR